MIKKIFLIVMLALAGLPAFSQSCYWVFLTDKQGTTFDPYAYFDAKAIERYQQNGADLYDITNYPLNEGYVSQVNALATEEVGQSRWLNAMAVMAMPNQIEAITELPFVKNVVLIATDMQMATAKAEASEKLQCSSAQDSSMLCQQLVRMGGQDFINNGIDGRGIRIAVLDAGFPRVNTHDAFKHLRAGHRILDTWNFPLKKADVYGWNSHGLSTLSCITGIVNGQRLGLATGAEFLLYRTEVDLEPFKEEVWWMMGMERADKHGANIISSSLGYGKERYYTKDMDGTSHVAKAADIAARKGILVCNSAGNEADVKQWKTIITPADADSVLCIGGIEASLTRYRHISFSSLGPSADGRLKPNVSTFGHALAATNGSDHAVNWVDGTSFSCPLAAGFAACAWQTRPGMTAMQMMGEIQKSADMYPYFDYALGYGVPQASYFTDKTPRHKSPTFVMRETKDSVEVHLLVRPNGSSYKELNPTRNDNQRPTIFYNKQRPDGSLVSYSSVEYTVDTADPCIRFDKASLDSCTLNVCYAGYTDHFRLSGADRARYWNRNEPFVCTSAGNRYDIDENYTIDEDGLVPSNWGNCAKWRKDIYFMYGDNINMWGSEPLLSWSPSGHIGFRIMRAYGKAYCLGMGLEWNRSHYNYAPDATNKLDELIGLTNSDNVSQKKLNVNQFDFELFQRVRFVPGGIIGSKGLHWDLGLFVGWNANHRYCVEQEFDNGKVSSQYALSRDDYAISDYIFVMGAITRLTYDCIGIYLRFEDSIVHNKIEDRIQFPVLQCGIQLSF